VPGRVGCRSPDPVGRGHTRPRPKLRAALAGYDDFRIEVKDLTIRIDADSARVTFRREDTIDGRTLSQPGLKEL